MNVIEKLLDNNKFSIKEKKVAFYILEHPNELQSLTCRGLANKANVSAPTVLRMIEKLDIKGYQEFKIEFITTLEDALGKKSLLFSGVDTLNDIYRNILKIDLIRQSLINQVNEKLGYQEVYEIAKIIYNSKQIELYGEGIYYHLNKIMEYNLTRLGKKAIALNHIEDRLNQTFITKKDRVAIVLSYSGKRKSVNLITKLIKEKQTYLIAITADENSDLAKQADKLIHIDIQNYLNDSLNISFRNSVSHVYNIIIGALYARHCEEMKGNFEEFDALSKFI